MKIYTLLLSSLLITATAFAADNPKKQARSVHLGYQAPGGTIFYNEVTVQKVAKGSYFMACGWQHGYFGMQEIANGEHVVIFSVWDPTRGNDQNLVAKDKQVKVLFQGTNVKVKRFGGEGTGGQSFFKYPWKIGETCKFLVQAIPEKGKKTAYAGYFYDNNNHQWKHLVTFETLNHDSPMQGYYSFIEDFHRNFKSAHEIRRALFGNGWVKTTDGKWVQLTKARFTGDSNPSPYVAAGLVGNQFYLQNGWGTTGPTKLNSIITRPSSVTPHPNIMFLQTAK